MRYEALSAPVVSDFPEEWHRVSYDAHFWFQWRLRVFEKLITKHSIPWAAPLRVMEVGCGRGILRHQIETRTQWTIDGSDVNAAALTHCAPGRGRTLLYNVHDLKTEFAESYDGILLFDVIEHVAQRKEFLNDVLWHLKPGGWAVINVPALASLYSRYDKTVGHFERFDKDSLRALIESIGSPLELMETCYWGFSLLPVAWLRKYVLPLVPARKVVTTGFSPPSRWINQAFLLSMVIETSVPYQIPCGTSLMSFVRKSR